MSAALHLSLSTFNRARLSPSFPTKDWRDGVAAELTHRLREGELVEDERATVSGRAAAAPEDPDAFVTWFEQLRSSGPGQNDPLFPWLSASASLEEMKWFITQEVAGEAGFEDLVALTQIKMQATPKLELARNYWDEMGRGHESGMHGPMLGRLATELQLDPAAEVVWESLALSNLMIALAANRRYAHHAIGALGVIELTAPDRAEHVNRGLARLDVAGSARQYFALHATLDVKHSEAWNREVVRPLVAKDARAAHAIAEGALMRLEAGRRCFERYRRHFGLGSARAHQVEGRPLP